MTENYITYITVSATSQLNVAHSKTLSGVSQHDRKNNFLFEWNK